MSYMGVPSGTKDQCAHYITDSNSENEDVLPDPSDEFVLDLDSDEDLDFNKELNDDSPYSSKDVFSTFLPLERNLIYSYVIEALASLHECVVEQLPDLSRDLPTLASIMRLSNTDRRIVLAWQATLQAMQLLDTDVKVFCNFFLVHCHEAKYMDPSRREKFSEEMNMIIRGVIKSRALQESLLCAVQIAENGKTQRDIKSLPGVLLTHTV
ncbi:single-pass membrane and coiled-coil domain-containing protein 1 [Lissotriton helveticus]